MLFCNETSGIRSWNGVTHATCRSTSLKEKIRKGKLYLARRYFPRQRTLLLIWRLSLFGPVENFHRPQTAESYKDRMWQLKGISGSRTRNSSRCILTIPSGYYPECKQMSKGFLPAGNPGSPVFNFSNIHIAPFWKSSKDFGKLFEFLFRRNRRCLAIAIYPFQSMHPSRDVTLIRSICNLFVIISTHAPRATSCLTQLGFATFCTSYTSVPPARPIRNPKQVNGQRPFPFVFVIHIAPCEGRVRTFPGFF